METIRQTFSVANLYLNASADTIYQHLMNTQGIVAVTVALSDRLLQQISLLQKSKHADTKHIHVRFQLRIC